MTAEQIAAVTGVILSLVFSYVPGASDWFGGLSATSKRLVMAVLLAVVAGGAFGLSCANVLYNATCTQAGAIGLVNAFIAALVANQAAYLISPRSASASASASSKAAG